jgi:hypothetical protein
MLVTGSVVFCVATKGVCSVGPLVFDGKARETMIAASSASARYIFFNRARYEKKLVVAGRARLDVRAYS